MSGNSEFNHFVAGLRHLLLDVQFFYPFHGLAILLLQNVRRFVGQFQAEKGARKRAICYST